jgi:hypothetical protein
MLLWDFEVARRLYREEGKITHELDDLPIGVAIAVINHFMETNPNWHFQMDFIFQIFQGSYEERKKTIEAILEKHVVGSAPEAAIGEVRENHKR